MAIKISYLLYSASIIHLLGTAFAAPSPAAPFTLKTVDLLRDSASPFRSPVSVTPQSFNVSDPYIIHVGGTPMTIKWYAFRGPMPSSQSARCILEACKEIEEHSIEGQSNTPMGHFPYTYSEGIVNLWVRIENGETLTWGSWYLALRSFVRYLIENDRRGAQFIILWEEHGETKPVAHGHWLAELPGPF